MNSLAIYVDESPIKTDGEQYYLHIISTGLYIVGYVIKHRSQNDIYIFGFIKIYQETIVHDYY